MHEPLILASYVARELIECYYAHARYRAKVDLEIEKRDVNYP